MTEYDHYSEFDTDVETKLEELHEKIQEGIDYIWQKWDDSILSSNWGWLISPGLKAAVELHKGNLEDEIEKLWDSFETKAEEMWDKVNDLTGDPWALMLMNDAYLTAAGKIRDETVVVGNMTAQVKKGWEGDAYDSYFNTATKQTNAITGVDKGLVAAAAACAAGALQVRSIWRDFIDEMLNIVDAILDAIKDATDAGQWVTFDAGPAIKVIGKIAVEALRFWNKLDSYFDTNATVNTGMWTDLNNGVVGLDGNNDWPKIPGYDLADLGNKGEWDHK